MRMRVKPERVTTLETVTNTVDEALKRKGAL
jgi:hypothetical protein